MAGYLKANRPGELQPPDGGWYATGDIVTLDDEGFVTIQGRVERFAKVGGEMVSLAAVETWVARLWPAEAHAVTTLPDPKKGEQLVLVTARPDPRREEPQVPRGQRRAAGRLPAALVPSATAAPSSLSPRWSSVPTSPPCSHRLDKHRHR